jgi:predicted MPP superfamily phosphohydrolase
MKRAGKILTGLLFCIPLLVGCDFPILSDLVMDPGSPRGISVLLVSDLHMRARDPLYGRMVDRINENAPDLIVFTGDLVESAEALPILSEYLERLPPSAPKYAVLGNWEYWGEVPVAEYRAALLSCGVTLLVNETVDIDVKGTPVRIHGMDDYLGGLPSFAGFTPDPGALNIVLAHCPILFDQLVPAYGSTGIPI